MDTSAVSPSGQSSDQGLLWSLIFSYKRPMEWIDVQLGKRFLDRYVCIKEIGAGTFSSVWMAFDLDYSQHSSPPFVAIKITQPNFPIETQPELEALQAIMRNKETGDYPHHERIIDLLSHFCHIEDNKCYIGYVMPLTAADLRSYLCRQKNLELAVAKEIIQQTLEGLLYLHESCYRIHGDLKPENLWIVPDAKKLAKMCKMAVEEIRDPWGVIGHFLASEQRKVERALEDLDKIAFSSECGPLKILLGDLGCSISLSNPPMCTVQTRFYRAPEIILLDNYGAAADMWSVGCIFYELLTGVPLFALEGIGHEVDVEHLMLVETIIGKIPENMKRSRKAMALFSNFASQPLNLCGKQMLAALLLVKGDLSKAEAEEVAEFLTKLLTLDQFERLTAREALNHRFFKGPPEPVSESLARTMELSDIVPLRTEAVNFEPSCFSQQRDGCSYPF